MARRGRRQAEGREALVSLPARRWSPALQLALRVLVALALVAAIVGIVFVDRAAYTDSHDGEVALVDAVADANLHGHAAIVGDGPRRDILRQAEVSRVRQVIITVDRDDSAILAVLTARQLNPNTHVSVSAREEANAALMRPAGADTVITSSEAVGRLLGLSAVSPNLGTVQELLSTREGLDLHGRAVAAGEVGRGLDEVDEPVAAAVRDQSLRRFDDPAVATLGDGDRVVVVQAAEHH